MTDTILALDQGTTSSRAILFDADTKPIASGNVELPQLYPRPGWVEHDPEAIWASQLEAARRAVSSIGIAPARIAAIGIANQRETTILWDRKSGEVIQNAIVWQDRRTTPLCEALSREGWDDEIRRRTGLVIDPYFSATKIRWLLDNLPGLRARAERGEIAFGTVDSFLVHRLSAGRRHVTDIANASRTMLFNIHRLDWDDDILRELRIPRSVLPEVISSSEVVGVTGRAILGREIPIAGVAGDQQAATFGQACFRPGMAKQTYGTGSFMLMNTGRTAVESGHGLLTTIAWRVGGETTYALEGTSFIAGAAVQWLRDGLGMISSAAETEQLAGSVETTGGVYFVPAFAGLGAPFWDPTAKGALLGLTGGTSRHEIARAVLEAVAFQTRDLAEAMTSDSGIDIRELRVDGGMVVNDILMQIQANILGRDVIRPQLTETTALGVAYLAGIAVGLWDSIDDLERRWELNRRFQPAIDRDQRERMHHGWLRAVERVRHWEIGEL